MTTHQRASLRAFWSKRWVLKFICVVVAVPVVLSMFAPVMGAAQGMYG